MHSVLKRTQLLLLLQQFRRFVQQGVDALLIFRSVIGLHRNRLFLLTFHVARERIVIDGIGILVNGRSFFILLICMYTHTPIDMVSGILQSCIHCGGEHVQHSPLRSRFDFSIHPEDGLFWAAARERRESRCRERFPVSIHHISYERSTSTNRKHNGVLR